MILLYNWAKCNKMSGSLFCRTFYLIGCLLGFLKILICQVSALVCCARWAQPLHPAHPPAHSPFLLCLIILQTAPAAAKATKPPTIQVAISDSPF